MHVTKRFALAAAVVALTSQMASAEMRTVEGAVIYRERMALPPSAQVDVRLLDVSLQDAPAKVLARTRVRAGNPPIPYRLRYNAARLDPRMTYALQAQIRVNGQLWFTSTTRVTFAGEPRIDIPVQRVAAAPERVAASPEGSWIAEDIRGGGVVDRVQTTLVLGADGSVSGSGGCNSYGGTARLDGAAIQFNRVRATLRACPPAVMDQERKFHEALAAARRWDIDPAQRKLVLRDGAGQPVLVFARV